MKDCEFQPLLAACHDRELDAVAGDRLERHLPDCPECAAELAGLREVSARITMSLADDMSAAESARLHAAIERAVDESDRVPLFRTAGLLAALAASVLIVCGVWLLDTRPVSSGIAGASSTNVGQIAAAPEWERVAMTLRADPRATVAGEVFYALRYSSTVDWMIDGLIPRDRKSWAKPSSF